jgi:hypothetical protein
MPWCDECAKFWNPTSMAEGGACPTCGRVLEAPDGPAFDAREAGKSLNVRALAGEDEKIPWHFKLMVFALALYLGWRLVQLVVAIVT